MKPFHVPIGARIHPSAVINSRPEHRNWLWEDDNPYHAVELGADIVVRSFVTIDGGISVPTRVGPCTILMSKVHIGHDCQVGRNCEIAVGATLAGHVVLGDRVKVGVNACFKPGVVVGDDARIGCGAVVVSDVPAGETWAGNPARPLHPESRAYSKGLKDNAQGAVETCEYEITWPS